MPLVNLLSTRTKIDHVKQLKEYLTIIENEKKNSDEVKKNLHKTLLALKDSLFGSRDGNSEPTISDVSQLCGAIYSNDLILSLITNLSRVTFEDRKEIVAIFNNLLRRQVGTKYPAVDHIVQRSIILMKLIDGYENADIALNCGMMLRECLRVQELTEIILKSTEFYRFFDFVQKSTFDIASDAFVTFKDLLTKHKTLCADFLENNYDVFFAKYNDLLNSENYVTRRQSLKLLGELLLDRYNYTVMNKFISNPENLKQQMNLLKERSKNIQFEAFHVFKIFVANPNKPKPIVDILHRNQEKLIEFLTNFHTDRTDDEQFNDEKSFLIKQISEL